MRCGHQNAHDHIEETRDDVALAATRDIAIAFDFRNFIWAR
jgi:hypothetical protein